MFRGKFAFRMLLASSIWIACLTSSGRSDDVPLRHRFQSDAQVQWKQLRIQFARLQAEVIDSSERPGLETQKNVHEAQIAKYNSREDCLRYEAKTTAGSTTGREYVACYNPSYAFTAVRKGPNEPLDVKYLGPGRDRVIQELQARYVMFVGLMLHSVPIDTLFADSSCKVEDVTAFDIDGRIHAKVTFTSHFTPANSYTILDGEVVLDPERLWTLRQFKMRVQEDTGVGILSGNTEYYDATNPVLPRRQVHEVRLHPEQSAIYRRTIDFTNVKPGDVLCKDCMMSAFGLTEPGIAAAPGTNRGLLIVLSVVAFLCLIAAVLLHRKSAVA